MEQITSTVRNSAGDVVEFLYGEDGMDGFFYARLRKSD